MTPADVLSQAADLIERDGWWRGDRDGLPRGHRLCAYLAIEEVWMRDESIPYREVVAAFKSHIRYEHIDRWNDRQPNGDVVCKALRDCARSL